MPRRTLAVLFDLDGTLVDSAPDLGAAADQMRVVRGLPSLPLEIYRPMAGAGARGMLEVAFGMNPDSAGFEAMRSEYLDNYARCLTQRTHAFDGVAEVITALNAQGLPWGVVTNKHERFTLPLTQQMPMFATASVIVSGDTTPHAKPHPAPLLEAARRLGLDPQGCMYVGDDERDIVAGHAAGMYTVAACYGYLGRVSDIHSWGSHATIDLPQDLLKLLG